jgi:predicted transposase YdaD
MPKPFDATTKDLVEAYPQDWIACLNLPTGAVSVADADLATVTTEADRVLRVEAATPYIAHAEVSSRRRKTFWTSAFIVAGLKYPAEFIAQLFQGVTQMKESSTYQAILREGLAEGIAKGRAEGMAEGRADGERRILLRLGALRLGTPSLEVIAALEAITAADRLERMADRLFEVESWEELLREL